MGTTLLHRLCLAGLAFAALAQTAHALDVELVTATAGPARQNGIFTDYFMSFTVEGKEIAGGTVFRPGLPPTPVCQLVFAGPGFLADEHWSCEREEFASLDDLCQQIGFGDFLIEVVAANGPDDSVTIAFDPGCADPFDGNPMIAAPSPGVPDGAGVTEAMTALKGAADGSSLNVSWDTASCCDAAVDHHLIWGFGASLPVAPGGTHSPDGSECDIGISGSFAWAGVPDPGPGNFLWWLVLADDDLSTEGAWGTDGSGLDRNGPGPEAFRPSAA